MGALDGGYQTLVDALGVAIEGLGGSVPAQHAREGDRLERRPRGRARSARAATSAHDQVISTLLPTATAPLLGRDLAAAVGPETAAATSASCAS